MRSSTYRRLLLTVILSSALGLGACGDDGGSDMGGGNDAGGNDAGGNDAGDVDGGHTDAGMTDGGVTDFQFRTDEPDAYTRVERMAMPAVSTALISSKNDYNTDGPADDVMIVDGSPKWAPEIVAALSTLHDALDDDLAGLDLTPCDADPAADPSCVSQEVAAGLSVVDLVIPDTVTLDTSATPGFPNGRLPADPVMDVTLAVILLDLTVHSATTLAEVPVNPMANDVAFLTEFPYLAAPHTP